LKVLKRAYELAGKTIIGTAISGVATEKIQQSMGGEARTLASLIKEFSTSPAEAAAKSLKHHARMLARAAKNKKTWREPKKTQLKLDENTIFFPDESGMIDLLAMNPFLKELDRCKASVLFIGDQKAQLAPVGPGNPTEFIDAKTLVGELKHNWRQTEIEAKASLKVREGNSAEALTIYQDKGDLIITKDFSTSNCRSEFLIRASVKLRLWPTRKAVDWISRFLGGRLSLVPWRRNWVSLQSRCRFHTTVIKSRCGWISGLSAISCRCMIRQVYSVFMFGQQISRPCLDRIAKA
jgi:AAA domain